MSRRLIKRAVVAVAIIIAWRLTSELIAERRRLAASGELPRDSGPWRELPGDATPVGAGVSDGFDSTAAEPARAVASVPEPPPSVLEPVAAPAEVEADATAVIDTTAAAEAAEDAGDATDAADARDLARSVTRELHEAFEVGDGADASPARRVWVVVIALVLAVGGVVLSAWAVMEPLDDGAWWVAVAGAVCALIGIALAIWPRRATRPVRA